MKKMFFSVVLLASLLFGACNKSDDDSTNNGSGSGSAAYTETAVSEAPVWQMDWSNSQERPDWTKPDESLYGNWTTLVVQIEETLQPYVSQDDLMALFINGELRGLAKPAIALGGSERATATFLMKVHGNETGTETLDASLQYYSQTLRHLFTLSDRITLNSDETTGTDEAYIPQFTLGSAKYPVVKVVNVGTVLTKAGLTAGEGMVGAFVGEECRGKLELSASGGTPSMAIFGRSVGESVTLRYYDATKGQLYTITDAVKL